MSARPANWPFYLRDPGPRDWPEDAANDEDNGCYQNVCVHCKATFIGNKRRQPCRVCAYPVIEKAYVRVEGDPSVGIAHQDFELTLHVDTSNDWDRQQLAQLRENIRQLYIMAHGEEATVTFDYEVEARAVREPVEP